MVVVCPFPPTALQKSGSFVGQRSSIWHIPSSLPSSQAQSPAEGRGPMFAACHHTGKEAEAQMAMGRWTGRGHPPWLSQSHSQVPPFTTFPAGASLFRNPAGSRAGPAPGTQPSGHLLCALMARLGAKAGSGPWDRAALTLGCSDPG